jgi:phage FluMu gp28-like protein
MRTVRLSLPRPHPGQRKILDSCRRFNVIACGRRFGKTVLAMDRLVGPALHRRPVAYFAPTYKMLAEVWRELRHTLHPVTAKVNIQEHRIELATGGTVDMWSLDNADAARGRKYARVVLDEAAMVGDLEDAWNYAIRPTLTDFKGGADFLSTPRGRNFFWRAYTWGEDPAEPDWACWRMPTVANPHIDPAEVEAARRQLPERSYQQEYEATFLDESGGVFRNVRACIDAGRTDNEPSWRDSGCVLGVDLARVEDFTVLCVLDPAGRQVYFERFNQISWERQIAAVCQAADAYRAAVVVDCTGVGDPIYERLRDAGLYVTPYHFTNATKSTLIDGLAMRLERGKLRLMDVPEQANELLAYQYELTPSRNVRTGAPAGMHDDCVMALALAAWGVERAGGAIEVDTTLADWRG